MMITLAGFVVTIILLWLYLNHKYTKLSRRGVNHLPVVPFFGNLFWVLVKKQHMIDCIMNIIRAYPEDRVVGHYDLVNPVFIVHDLEIVKNITIKDHEHFVDRREVTTEHDPILGRGMMMLKGEEWKAMRTTMSPAFTSSKIRLMAPSMFEVSEKITKGLKKKIEESGNEYIDLEVKELASRYASDVIASCAFGLKVNSQSEEDFFKLSSQFTGLSLGRVLKVFLYRIMPKFAKMIKLTIIPQNTGKIFKDLILDSMKYREEKQLIRNDLINLLMEVKKGQQTHDKDKDMTPEGAGFTATKQWSTGKKKHNFEWTDNDLVSQAVILIFAGFETISTAIMFILHELAAHPEVQDRLVQEIRQQDIKNSDNFDFKAIEDMTYMDMVISECLRLWPPFIVMDRCCVKGYNIGKPNSKAKEDLIIRKGETVVYPAWVFHHDPELFPDPYKFDPERFSPQNRDKIKPASYMPFGMGPRNCIGSRLALCEIKVMLYQILREVEVVPCEKSCIPIKLFEGGFQMRIKGGAWLRFKVRSGK